MKFTCIDTGLIVYTKGDNRYLENCPICKNRLHSNRYKNLEVIKEGADDVNIEIAMEYCEKCSLLFIREGY